MKRFGYIILSTLLIVGFATALQAAGKDIIGTAKGMKDCSTFVSMVKDAGLTDTLSGKGPFTVFVPNNAAWEKLDPAFKEQLMKNKDQLANVLKYHVIPQEVMASGLQDMSNIRTAAGGDIMVQPGPVLNEGAKVVEPDIKASNGIIHVIDTVMVP